MSVSLHATKSWRTQNARSIPPSNLLTYAAIAYQIYSKVCCNSLSFWASFSSFPTLEKLYEIEHPRYAKQFDDISLVPEDELGYWVSKRWCRGQFCITAVFHFVDCPRCPSKDWRLLKPKMHIASEEDPAPDSSQFYSHVHCEHGGLSLNTTLRRKISREVRIQGLSEDCISSIHRL
jgi:hypothetical protein